MEKILLTGFKPFGSYSKNVSEIMVNELSGKIIDADSGNKVKIVGLKLPIDYRIFRKILEKNIEEIKPKIVIGLGMDFKDLNHLSLELVAHNIPLYGRDIKDEMGYMEKSDPLDGNKNELILPNQEKIKKIISKIDGIEISKNAGRHMCETVFRDIIRISNDAKKFQPLFIHLPHTKDLIAESRKLEEHKEWLSIEKQKEIVEEVISKVA